MTVHLPKQIERLERDIPALGEKVEAAVGRAIQAVEKRDIELARRVTEADAEIDQMELDVEEECMHTLALHQPVAFDLRYVIAVLKINNDLERIADLAVNVAEQAQYMVLQPQVDIASYGPTPFEAEALRMEVQSALLSVLRRVAASTLIHWIEDAGGAVSGRDADTRWPLTVQSFQALYSLETVA